MVESEGAVHVRRSTGEWFLLDFARSRQDTLVLEGEFGEKYSLRLDKPVGKSSSYHPIS